MLKKKNARMLRNFWIQRQRGSEWEWSKYFSRITVKAKTEKYQFVERQGSWRLTYLTKHRLPCHMGWKPLSLFWRGCWWRWWGHSRTTMTTTLSHRWRQGCVTDIVENIYLLRLRGLMLTRELGTVGSTVVWGSGLGTVRFWYLFMLTLLQSKMINSGMGIT